jgi:hypothetical protein
MMSAQRSGGRLEGAGVADRLKDIVATIVQQAAFQVWLLEKPEAARERA